jgi:hypothetical protein
LQAAKEILMGDEETISYLLGGITVGTAVVGTLGGGVLCIPGYSSNPLHDRGVEPEECDGRAVLGQQCSAQ